MPTALFINGVFRTTLAEIEKTQQDHPGKICYLQPYASGSFLGQRFQFRAKY